MGVEVSKTGVEWVDKQIKEELDNLQNSKFDKDISINYLKKLNKNSYKEMMSKNSGATIVAIQVLLKEAGYDVGKIDGILKGKGQTTSKTIEAVKAFQKKNGLKPDGVPGPLTVNKLLEIYDNGGGNAGGNEQVNEEDEKVKDLTEEEYIALCGKTSLTDDEVKQIVKYANKNGGTIFLDLTSITDKQAEELSKVSYLSLDGLTSITDKQAEELSKVGRLSLDGLTSITDKQAENLSKVEDPLSLDLNGLTTISAYQCKVLCSKRYRLSLDGLVNITKEQAKELGRLGQLSLNGVKNITEEQAEELGKVNDTLYLNGLTSITDRQAEELAKVKNLYINKNILTPEQKEILKAHIS